MDILTVKPNNAKEGKMITLYRARDIASPSTHTAYEQEGFRSFERVHRSSKTGSCGQSNLSPLVNGDQFLLIDYFCGV